MSTYQELLAKAMAESTLYKTPTELGNAIGSTSQAVSQVLSGSSKMFGAENHSKAAEALEVRPVWLATGDGGMRYNLVTMNDTAIARYPSSAILSAISSTEIPTLPNERDRLLTDLCAVAHSLSLLELAELKVRASDIVLKRPATNSANGTSQT